VGVNIHLKPTQVWQFFSDNKDRLKKEMVAIAENEETEHAIYLTEDKDLPLLSVYRGDDKLNEEGAISAADCEDTAKRLYLKYLFPVVVSAPKYSVEDKPWQEPDDQELAELERQDIDDKIYEREDELRLAMSDFLEILLNCKGPEELEAFYGDIIEDLLDGFCQFLADEHLISVYRPTWITDDDTGCEIYTEYPYLEVDEENAIGT